MTRMWTALLSGMGSFSTVTVSRLGTLHRTISWMPTLAATPASRGMICAYGSSSSERKKRSRPRLRHTSMRVKFGCIAVSNGSTTSRSTANREVGALLKYAPNTQTSWIKCCVNCRNPQIRVGATFFGRTRMTSPEVRRIAYRFPSHPRTWPSEWFRVDVLKPNKVTGVSHCMFFGKKRDEKRKKTCLFPKM